MDVLQTMQKLYNDIRRHQKNQILVIRPFRFIPTGVHHLQE